MRVLKWFGIAGLAAIALTSKVDPAYASDDSSWPHRPITIVLSQPAGSSPDIIARILAERMSEILKQPIVIDNRGGGQNVIGAMHAQRARPDGYTYYLGTAAAMATNPYTLKNLPYDPLKDFEPVGLVGISPFLVVTRADVPAKSLAELIQLSKDTPDGLNFASDGQYGFGSMIGEWLKRATDLKFVNVPYTGAAGAVQDLMSAEGPGTGPKLQAQRVTQEKCRNLGARLGRIGQVEDRRDGRFGFERQIDQRGVFLAATQRAEPQEIGASFRQHDPFAAPRSDEVSRFVGYRCGHIADPSCGPPG